MATPISFPTDPYQGQEHAHEGRTWVFEESIPAWRPKVAETPDVTQVLIVNGPQSLSPAKRQQGQLNLGIKPAYRTTLQGAPDVTVVPTNFGQLCFVGDDLTAVDVYTAVRVSPPLWRQLIVASDEGFSVTPPDGGPLKSFNPNGGTVEDLMDFVATLAQTLKDKSII